MEWFSHPMPGISINPIKVKIIKTPEQFYNTLIEKTKEAKTRISLSSLYLGDGVLEKKLIKTIETNLETNSQLKVTVLLDFLRGTRGVNEEKSSTTLLKSIANRAKVFLYHTPDLNGFLKKVLPERTNEIIGLQHMKLYIFDNSLLISGANLSDSYFTNRQDRYVLFEDCELITNFFHDIINAIGDQSFELKSDQSIEINTNCIVHPFLGNSNEYRKILKSNIEKVINNYKNIASKTDSESSTFIYPVIQIGNLEIHQEFDFLKQLFAQKDESLKITMASGYFNCNQDYEDLIFNKGNYQLNVLTASPRANGFFNANGLSKHVPALYSDVSSKFLSKIQKSNRNTIKLYEYYRNGWTFHAKGLWIEKNNYLATMIGSSNYGYRSVHRDLEAQVLVITKDDKLIERFKNEKKNLFDFSTVLDVISLRKSEHHVPILVKFISNFIRNFF